MFPWVTGFQWTIGNVIFLGLFFTVIAVVFATLFRALLEARRELGTKPAEALRWEFDFSGLPLEARACRHELTGEVGQRTCPNHFDCASCDRHPVFEAIRQRNSPGGEIREASVYGFSMPADRLYHRAHTWARPEPDGTMVIGLDDLGRRVVGTPDAVSLPAPGARLLRNGPAWTARRRGAIARFLSPVDGEVVATGGPDDEWMIRLKPLGGGFETRHLLHGAEIRPWILREMERLELALAPGTIGSSLADGGLPVEDFPKNMPEADWDEVWGEIFLEPA